MNLTHQDYWYYSMMWIFDVGSYLPCEKQANDGKGATYIQMFTNITHFPYWLPLSICAPKECEEVSSWDYMAEKLTAMT